METCSPGLTWLPLENLTVHCTPLLFNVGLVPSCDLSVKGSSFSGKEDNIRLLSEPWDSYFLGKFSVGGFSESPGNLRAGHLDAHYSHL